MIKTSQSTVDPEAWKYFCQMLEYLSVDGMSSEEDSAQQVGGRTVMVFLVKLCIW